jgi:hypothetical protein
MNREAAEAAAAAAAGGSGTTAPVSPSSTAMPSFFDEFTGRVHYDLTEGMSALRDHCIVCKH